jgi:hypothetical protein
LSAILLHSLFSSPLPHLIRANYLKRKEKKEKQNNRKEKQKKRKKNEIFIILYKKNLTLKHRKMKY